MPESLAFTTIQETVRRLADAALKRPDGGVTVFFPNANYPSPAICKKAAIRLRNNFNAMKGKAKKKMNAQYIGTPGYNSALPSTPYDNIGAFIEETATGWQLRVATGDSLLEGLDIIETATGQRPREFTSEYGRWDNLLNMVLKLKAGDPSPLSEEDVAFFWSFDPHAARRTWAMLGWQEPQAASDLDKIEAERNATDAYHAKTAE